ncbi:MAG: hypothetical protein KGJ84_00685 [Elusimicrobia bacterium]|nr:hypothetical protein [Elusimicrobiota bacterium]
MKTTRNSDRGLNPMRKNLMLAALSCLVLLAAAVPSRADETHMLGKDLSMTVGYKLWINTWETAIGGASGTNHVIALTKGYDATSVPNLSFKYRNWLLSGSYLVTGDYQFPSYQERFNNGLGNNVSFTASRTETDVNAGYYATPNLVLTLGYKNVEQKYKESVNGTSYPATKTHYNGVTAGLGGSAGIGHGFAMYGNAAGGLMSNTYTPSSGNAQTAFYEASEVGFAWHNGGFGTSIGYKFQYLTTHGGTNVSADVTRGYMLGMNYTF